MFTTGSYVSDSLVILTEALPLVESLAKTHASSHT